MPVHTSARQRCRRSSGAEWALILFLSGWSAVAAVPGVETVVALGTTLDPDSGSELALATVDRVQISPAGHVVVIGKIFGREVTSANNQALVTFSPAGETRIALRTGDQRVDRDGLPTTITQITQGWVDHNGAIAARVVIGPSARSAILAGPPSDLQWIVHAGMEAGGSTLTHVAAPMLTPAGRLLYHGWNSDFSVDALWSGSPSESSRVITIGNAYPGLPGGEVLTRLSDDFASSDSGLILLRARLGPNQVDGLWLDVAGTLVSIWSAGVPAPGMPELLSEFDGGLWLADDGWMAFRERLRGTGVHSDNSPVLYAAFGDTIHIVVRSGDPAPGTLGAVFGPVWTVYGLGLGGRLLFGNYLRFPDGSAANSLWVWEDGALRELAEEGQLVGMGSNPEVLSINFAGISPGGRIAFGTTLVGLPSHDALWTLDPHGSPYRVFGTGDAMPSPTGGLTEVRGARFLTPLAGPSFDTRGRFLASLVAMAGGTTVAWVDPDALVANQSGTISGRILEDTDGSGGISELDQGLGGARLELYRDDGSGHATGEALASIETAANGRYLFTRLEPGGYVVIQAPLPGYESLSGDSLPVVLTEGTAAPGHDFLVRQTLPTATLSLHRLEPDAVSNLMIGPEDVWPLLPRLNMSRVASLPEVQRGWVADGVTPLILCATFRPEDLSSPRDIRWRLVDSDDAGMKQPLSESLLIPRIEPCQPGSEGVNRVSSDCPRSVAILLWITEPDLAFREGTPEIRATVVIEDAHTGQPLAQRTVALRRPPVVLLHDANSTGDWGAEFQKALATEGRPFVPGDARDNFVRTVRYGQKDAFTSELLAPRIAAYLKEHPGDFAYGMVHRENTILPLEALVLMLDQALPRELELLREDWAITHFDVVAHGQGGVLARMLASVGMPDGFPTPFRSLENFYRGRFRRVVTIGSPFNGSRLLGYLRKLDPDLKLAARVPPSVVALGLLSHAMQDKFDPFGGQIFRLNLGFASNPWRPDPLAKFHRIAATIGLQKPPGPGTETLIAVHLGLNGEAGPLVLPYGFDGMVDLSSALAQDFGTPPDHASLFNAAFSFRDPFAAHSRPIELFRDGPGVQVIPQTEFPELAEFIRRILPWTRSSDAPDPFGPFPPLSLLDDSEEKQFQDAAIAAFATLSEGTVGRAIPEGASFPSASGLARFRAATAATGETVFRYRLDAPDRLPDSQVNWSIATFGPTTSIPAGIRMTPLPDLPDTVDITIPDSMVGDVVLYARYSAADGRAALIQPVTVTRRDPIGAQIAEIAVIPPGGEYPAGESITPQLLVAYDNGTVMQRYLAADNLTVTSSAPAVVDVSDPVAWKLVSPGQATLDVSYRSYATTSVLTVYQPQPLNSAPWIIGWAMENDTFSVTIASPVNGPWRLWKSPNIEDPVWTAAEDAIVESGGNGIVTLGDPHAAGGQAYYRVSVDSPCAESPRQTSDGKARPARPRHARR